MVHKTIDQAKANLEASVSYIPARWLDGVKAADWATPAGSDQAETNYAAGVGKAVANKTRQKKVKEKSNSDWQGECESKGAGVIGARITGALDKYASNFGPVLGAMNAAADRAKPSTTDWKTNITNRLYPVVEAAKRAAGKA